MFPLENLWELQRPQYFVKILRHEVSLVISLLYVMDSGVCVSVCRWILQEVDAAGLVNKYSTQLTQEALESIPGGFLGRPRMYLRCCDHVICSQHDEDTGISKRSHPAHSITSTLQSSTGLGEAYMRRCARSRPGYWNLLESPITSQPTIVGAACPKSDRTGRLPPHEHPRLA